MDDPVLHQLIFHNDSSDDELTILMAAIAIEEEQLENVRGSTSRCPRVEPRRFIERNPLQGHERLFHDYFAEEPVFAPNIFRRRFRMSRSLFLRIIAAIEAHEPHLQGHERLFHDYFAEEPVFAPNIFRRRFRMSRSLFLRIIAAIEAHEPHFVQRRNAAGRLGLSSHQKMTAALRMLAYGVPGDALDEYIRIGESTTLLSLKKFVEAVVFIFSDEYLRSPNSSDIARLLQVGESHGFPGMLGSMDCMHLTWRKCPTAWKCMYTGHNHDPTVILKAVASYDLWIWHAFFGLPGSNNDINVLERSSVFANLIEGRTPPVNYSINGHDYTMGYYLAEGIYPKWATFVKIIPLPQGNKKKNFAAAQESARKDVERAFGVLQARFAIVRGPSRFLERKTMHDIMTACIILHNMIIEDEGHVVGDAIDATYEQSSERSDVPICHDYTPELMEFIQSHHRIRDRGVHSQLQADLVEHLWNLHSMS